MSYEEGWSSPLNLRVPHPRFLRVGPLRPTAKHSGIAPEHDRRTNPSSPALRRSRRAKPIKRLGQILRDRVRVAALDIVPLEHERHFPIAQQRNRRRRRRIARKIAPRPLRRFAILPGENRQQHFGTRQHSPAPAPPQDAPVPPRIRTRNSPPQALSAFHSSARRPRLGSSQFAESHLRQFLSHALHHDVREHPPLLFRLLRRAELLQRERSSGCTSKIV